MRQLGASIILLLAGCAPLEEQDVPLDNPPCVTCPELIYPRVGFFVVCKPEYNQFIGITACRLSECKEVCAPPTADEPSCWGCLTDHCEAELFSCLGGVETQ